jgi:catechol 2,3-dioxygenase-like lactoylglutathione lyase family enzyme
MLESFDHVCIVAQDIEKLATFYTEALGLKVTRRVNISGPWIDQTVKLENVQAEVIYLELPAGPRLELIQFSNPRAARPDGLGESNTPGLRHLAFRVSSIDTVIVKLRSAGVQFFSGVQRVPLEQVNYGAGIQKRLIYFQDPEGNLLELCEYKSGD